MISLADVPIWLLVAVNALLALSFWLGCAVIGRSASARIRAALALGTAYAGVALRSAAGSSSVRMTLVLAAEGLLILGLAVLPFVGYIKTEVAAQRAGREVNAARSSAMAMRLVGLILGLLAIFLCIDAFVIRGFFATHS